MMGKSKYTRATASVTSSAAALMLALGASASAHAAVTSFTLTVNDANGQTYTASFGVDGSNPLSAQSFNNGGFENRFAMQNPTGFLAIAPGSNPYIVRNNFNVSHYGLHDLTIGASNYVQSSFWYTGNDVSIKQVYFNVADPGIYTLSHGFASGTFTLDAASMNGKVMSDLYDSDMNALSRTALTFSPLSATLKIAGPGAPAPLVGTGLLSALTALAALAMTRLLGRKTAPA